MRPTPTSVLRGVAAAAVLLTSVAFPGPAWAAASDPPTATTPPTPTATDTAPAQPTGPTPDPVRAFFDRPSGSTVEIPLDTTVEIRSGVTDDGPAAVDAGTVEGDLVESRGALSMWAFGPHQLLDWGFGTGSAPPPPPPLGSYRPELGVGPFSSFRWSFALAAGQTAPGATPLLTGYVVGATATLRIRHVVSADESDACPDATCPWDSVLTLVVVDRTAASPSVTPTSSVTPTPTASDAPRLAATGPDAVAKEFKTLN